MPPNEASTSIGQVIGAIGPAVFVTAPDGDVLDVLNLTGNRLLVQIVGLVDRSRQFSPSQKPANLTFRAPAWLLLEPFAHVGLCAYDEVVRMATEAPEANTKEGRDTLNALKEGQGMALGVRMIWPGEDDLRTVPVRFIGGKGPQPMRPAPVDSP